MTKLEGYWNLRVDNPFYETVKRYTEDGVECESRPIRAAFIDDQNHASLRDFNRWYQDEILETWYNS